MIASQLKGSTLVVFGKDFPDGHVLKRKFDTIIADKVFQKNVETLGCKFVELETLVEPGSIYEANAFLEELSRLTLSDGRRLSKSFTYKGYELWWMHYNSLFLYFCLPYTQYRKLLEYLKSFQNIFFYQPPYKSLFSCYLQAYGCEFNILRGPGLKAPSFLPFGVLLQILITLLCVPILMVRKRRIMLFTGDKFEKSRDYDFRMRFIYEELRQKNLHFVEFIRSLESWKTVIKHAVKRRRPVIYSEGVAFIGRFVSVILGGHRRARRRFGAHTSASQTDPAARFKLLVATQYLLGVYDDIWAIRIMKWILYAIGVRAAIITAATERNFHSVLGCKLNTIPTVGILHGAASRHYNVYDFLPAFDGAKMLSVDKYGLWSDWWKEYYMKNSKAYRPEQLFVSGPMRPFEVPTEPDVAAGPQNGLIRVLFVAEQTVVPGEVMPYLRKLLDLQGIELTITFRPYRDGFEEWLLQHEPQILKLQHVQIVKRGIQEAIQNADVVVGCHSTGVLEALLQLKVPVFLRTQKWGDY
ncbi:hypothetical protein IIA94_01225, partial [Patescibacteria group bacterium]|nr:hypothetical protein [Patescibacteria group bacterium]